MSCVSFGTAAGRDKPFLFEKILTLNMNLFLFPNVSIKDTKINVVESGIVDGIVSSSFVVLQSLSCMCLSCQNMSEPGAGGARGQHRDRFLFPLAVALQAGCLGG